MKGIIPNSFEHIFKRIARSTDGEQFLVRASYLEIYLENIRDLLSKKNQKLSLKENESGVSVVSVAYSLFKIPRSHAQ